MKNGKCVFAGSFDPPTLGHKQIIEDCLAVFDEVVVALMRNPNKNYTFTETERLEMLRLCVGENKGVKIIPFDGTIAELLEKEQTRIYVRGVRNATDFDYETGDMYATKRLKADVIPFYIPCPQELLHVSSSTVRALMRFDKPLDGYVTEEVKEYITAKKGE